MARRRKKNKLSKFLLDHYADAMRFARKYGLDGLQLKLKQELKKSVYRRR